MPCSESLNNLCHAMNRGTASTVFVLRLLVRDLVAPYSCKTRNRDQGKRQSRLFQQYCSTSPKIFFCVQSIRLCRSMPSFFNGAKGRHELCYHTWLCLCTHSKGPPCALLFNMNLHKATSAKYCMQVLSTKCKHKVLRASTKYQVLRASTKCKVLCASLVPVELSTMY